MNEAQYIYSPKIVKQYFRANKQKTGRSVKVYKYSSLGRSTQKCLKYTGTLMKT